MCAIVGIIHNQPSLPIEEPEFIKMRDSLAHRGPDDAGFLLEPGVALGSRRLSILDLSPNGHMPMKTIDGRYTIVHNGEVYNFQELRRQLEGRGYIFRSNGDTEVLLYLYQEKGPAMLDSLNGMFAFAIWDAQERTLFVARDRLGVKPLYFAEWKGKLLFASEAKALFVAGIPFEFRGDCWEELLCFRFVAGDSTPFSGIKRLLPGHYLLWRDGQCKIKRWWCLAERAEALRGAPCDDVFEWFVHTFDDAVRLRRISDVPVGVLLSGGLDSSCVAASLANTDARGLASFNVRFDEPDYDEGAFAEAMVRHTGMIGHHITVAPEELMGLFRLAAWHFDEPLVHGNDLHLLAISKYAKSRITVLLSGEGADEVLGGYVRYQPLRYLHLIKDMSCLIAGASRFLAASRTGSLGSRIQKLNKFMHQPQEDAFVLFNACDVLPTDLADLGMRLQDDFSYRRQILNEGKKLYPHSLLRQAMYADQHTFLTSLLDRNDRMTMAASVECRVPFLDYRLVEGLSALPASQMTCGYQTKPLLRKAFASRLPAAVKKHRKWGFSVPWQKYFTTNNEIRDVLNELPNLAPIDTSPLNRVQLAKMVTNYLNGNRCGESIIKELFAIAIWYDVMCGAFKSSGIKSLPPAP